MDKSMAHKGKPAPEFSVASDDKDMPVVSLESFAGSKLVLYFYPRDNTPGCTRQAVEFSQLKPDFEAAGTKILGISADSVKKHANFRKKHNLTILLGADPDLEVIKLYGVWRKKKLYGREYMGIARTTFLINENGEISKIWENVKVTGHGKEVLKAAQQL